MKKKILLDMGLNIGATFIPICILQLLLLPLIGGRMDIEQYGIMTSITALMTMISHTLGGTLNNVRLLCDLKYTEEQVKGDFNILLVIAATINMIIMFIGTWYYEGYLNVLNITLVIMSTIINLLREYFIVGFRLNLNYKAILINNSMLALGYVLGYVVFFATEQWQYVYLIGGLLSLVYVLKVTQMHREPYKLTKFFREVTTKGLILLISIALANMLNYVDRLMILPLFGASTVSIYYVSTLLGKVIGLGIGPICSVILSYISKIEKLPKNSFKVMLLVACTLGAVGYGFCIIISKPMINILYPLWADEAMKYIPITTFTAIITMLCSVINPMILRFCNMKWQIVINASSIIIYGIFTLGLVDKYGLMGFCIGTLVATFIKLIIMLIIYYISNKEKNIYKKEKKYEKEIIKEN